MALASPSLATFTVLALVLVITPGADTALLLRNAVAGGRSAAVATVLGSRLGLVVHALLAAAGLSAVLMASAKAFQVLKLVGAGYLVWLGIRSLVRAMDREQPPGSVSTHTSPCSPWREGFLTNLLNPKTAAFYLAVLPQFVGSHHPALRSLLLASIHIGLSLVWYLGLAMATGGARRWIRRPRVRRSLDAVSGTVLAALGLRLAFADR